MLKAQHKNVIPAQLFKVSNVTKKANIGFYFLTWIRSILGRIA
jgi:hypothetical protein